jgi:single-strand DNA-binding protein
MINRVIIAGRLVRDPELRNTASGQAVCDFTLAVAKKIKPKDSTMPDADFFKVICWGKTAEFAANYLGKGRLVAVDGRLQSRNYIHTDATKREIVEIVAESVQGLDRPRDDDAPKPAAQATTQDPEADFDPFAE